MGEREAAPVAVAGDTVKVHFTCQLEDGGVFSTSRNKEPLEFVVGNSQIIPGLQELVIGMKAGETKTEEVAPDKGYGPYHEEMKATLARAMVPEDLKLEVGATLRVRHADGHESDVFIMELDDDTVTVDGNHPLAGKKLVLAVELLELEKG